MTDELSVRQWQEQFQAGAFNAKDRNTQCAAGWDDGSCRGGALAGRLKKIARVVMGITDPFILDNYYVWFRNNSSYAVESYDDARFEPLTGERNGRYFLVVLDSPYENSKWVLYTERRGFFIPEFQCAKVNSMIQYINNMARELEQEVRSSSVDRQVKPEFGQAKKFSKKKGAER